MAIKVLAQNINDGFSHADRADTAASFIASQRPDVAVLSEAYAEGIEDLLSDIRIEFEAQGYYTEAVLYDDIDGRQDRHGLLVLAREKLLVASDVVNLAGRNAVKLVVTDPRTDLNIDLFGLHQDDRSKHSRLQQTLALLGFTNQETPTAVMGDFNDINNRRRRHTGIINGLGFIAGPLPKQEPGPNQGGFKISRLASVASRLDEMTSGDSCSLLESAGFHDPNVAQAPTWSGLGGLLRFDLDHLMLRGLEATNFHIHPGSFVSDHRAISANLIGPCLSNGQ